MLINILFNSPGHVVLFCYPVIVKALPKSNYTVSLNTYVPHPYLNSVGVYREIDTLKTLSFLNFTELRSPTKHQIV